MKKFVLFAFLTLISSSAQAAGPEPMQVVASFSVLGDMVQQVGGPDVEVTVLVGPNSDTHAYEPKPEDVKKLSAAKILFINGLGFEGWIPRLAAATNFKGKIIIVSKGVKPIEKSGGVGSKTIVDAHAWQSLANGEIYARNIAHALSEELPENEINMDLRAANFTDAMKAMDAKIRAAFEQIPPPKRRVITSHQAFGYFAAAYHIEFLAPVGLSTDAEPSAATLAKLITQMKQEGIKTVFLENMSNSRLAEQMTKESKAKLGEALYSDALSDPKGPAPTYIGMFENNLPKLVKAMQENDPR